MNVLPQKFTNGNTSPKSLALASLGAQQYNGGELYVAWKGDGNDNLNVAQTLDGGHTFSAIPGGKPWVYTSTETSPQAPALCFHNNYMYIAWKGDGNDNLNVAQVVQNVTMSQWPMSAPIDFANKTTMSDTSPLSPALASLGGLLFIAWKGDGNDSLNLSYSTDSGSAYEQHSITFAPATKYVSTQTSPEAPALCVHNDNLYIAWKGDGNDLINVAVVELTGSGAYTKISGIAKPVQVGANTSPLGPTLASLNGVLYVAWKGDGNDNLNVMCSSDNGRTFQPLGGASTPEYTDTSKNAPALCASGRALYIAWTGDGDDTLNFAMPAQQLLTGTVRPTYQVLTLVYAPPGTNGGKSQSSVTYGNTSTTGTTTSFSSSFQDGADVSISVGGGKTTGGSLIPISAGGDFNYSTTTTDSSACTISKSVGSTILVKGPPADGIDHDFDFFVLWLNPLISVMIDPMNNISWTPAADGTEMVTTYVYASQLKNPSTIPAGLQQQLSAAGLTASDYAQILALDPFASGQTAIDPGRFVPVLEMQYEPPLTPTADPVSSGYSQLSSVTTTTGHSTSYTTSVSISAGINIPGIFKLQVSGSFKWTNTSSSSFDNGSTQTASVSIAGPAYGYMGPESAYVYWDTVYNSFMFSFTAFPGRAVGVKTPIKTPVKLS